VSAGAALVEVSTGAALVEVSTGAALVEVSTGAALVEVSTGAALVEVSTGAVLVEVSTGAVLVEVSTGAALVEVSTGAALVEVSTGAVLVEVSAGAALVEVSAASADGTGASAARIPSARRIPSASSVARAPTHDRKRRSSPIPPTLYGRFDTIATCRTHLRPRTRGAQARGRAGFPQLADFLAPCGCVIERKGTSQGARRAAEITLGLPGGGCARAPKPGRQNRRSPGSPVASEALSAFVSSWQLASALARSR
jgi:hypothetical protein